VARGIASARERHRLTSQTAGAAMTEIESNGGRGVTYRVMEIVVAAIVLAFGALFMYSSYRLGFRWSADGPESGFFPFYVNLSIVLASLAIIVRSIVKRDARSQTVFVEWGQFKQVLSVLIPAAVFVLGIQLIGIYVSAAIYIALFMRFIGKYGWVRSIALSLIVAGVSFMMFEVWFQVPLFKGKWNPIAWTGY
jgi:hypothetical protein